MSNLKATKRDNTTSGSNNRLRADGFIPAIIYGGRNPNQNICISKSKVFYIKGDTNEKTHYRFCSNFCISKLYSC